MTKILKSRYSFYENFEEDVNGRFLFKMKRREITRKLFFFSKVLNRVEPLRLSDLLISKKKKIKNIVSFDKFRFRKIKYYYGYTFGKTKIFNKSQYNFSHRCLKNRALRSILSLEARIDILLLRLRLFSSIRESKFFIKSEGILINGVLIKNNNYRLSKGDILSFTKKFRTIFKRKIYRLLRARPSSVPFSNVATRELNSILTSYTWLFKRYTAMSPFTLLGFPRYIEANFNSMEFYFYGFIKPEDIFYPFKTSLQERTSFFNNYA
jgi:ribosomal protein S4